MLKPASSLCNLRCKYCFYHSLAETRESFSYGLMSDETAENVIIKALKFADGGSIYFAFQGGEPLMRGREFFRHFAEFATANNKKGSRLFFSMQTNGTLVDDDWCALFKEYGFLVGLSLDGNQKFNRNRVDDKGDYAFGRITRAADLMTKYGVDFNILTVLTADIAKNIEEVYRFFKASGYKFLQFIPCLRPFGSSEEGDLYMTPEVYGDFLIRLFNLYVKDYVDGNYISVRQLDNYVRLFLGERPEQCGMSGHCSFQFVVEGNGDVFPCDFYCTDEYRTGNILTDDFAVISATDTAKRFLEEGLATPSRCKRCPYYKLCRGGGCKRNRADRDYCAAYQKFFSSCLPLFRVFLGNK